MQYGAASTVSVLRQTHTVLPFGQYCSTLGCTLGHKTQHKESYCSAPACTAKHNTREQCANTPWCNRHASKSHEPYNTKPAALSCMPKFTPTQCRLARHTAALYLHPFARTRQARPEANRRNTALQLTAAGSLLHTQLGGAVRSHHIPNAKWPPVHTTREAGPTLSSPCLSRYADTPCSIHSVALALPNCNRTSTQCQQPHC